MTDSWSDDDRLSRLVNAGRQLVDGVSGARPGSRGASRSASRNPGRGRPAGVPRFDQLGRWVEDKLDRILEDDEDWREPWQEAPPQKPSRRPLEAISRRRGIAPAAAPAATQLDADGWPEDGAFAVARWQRPPSSVEAAAEVAPESAFDGASTNSRPLPRSTRRR
ncbi:hypothetical protein KBY58_10510 [Cyanobium sp. HWJ4-Hawea]|uniref:hypothetical protein n=1 Tax=Cyanobium sp. HWJ4-Hawea TaxID=2823713 RepID=UPI0020CB7355|nr:hypothetical protein [Cyanobium sp. HWJ4-Hawea]MCP9809865.1 hypothetical protein [Cyanobium sp. HWJ4-Hawea]